MLSKLTFHYKIYSYEVLLLTQNCETGMLYYLGLKTLNPASIAAPHSYASKTASPHSRFRCLQYHAIT